MTALPSVTPGTAVALALVATSVAFSLIALVGFARLPDVFARTHAASKSETLGALCGVAAAGVAFGVGPELLKLGMLALFVLATGPTAAHAIVRAATLAGQTPVTGDGGTRTAANGGSPDVESGAGSGDQPEEGLAGAGSGGGP